MSKFARFAVACAAVLCGFGVEAAFAETPAKWDLETLSKAPQAVESGTYLAMPKVAPGKKVPGMVFAHAGQDGESVRLAKFWCEKGYAAIAVKAKGDAYQDVAAVIRANSHLRSLPEVDGERIGLTGVSRGGVTACIAASVDSRFNFVAPISGCGYLEGESAYDPRHYLAAAKVPFFWVAGTNDRDFPLPSLQKSVATPGTPYYRSTRVGRALDSGVALACSQELVDFAAFRLKPEGSVRTSYPFMHDCRESGGEVWAVCTTGNDDGVAHAELNWTADRGAWADRKWTSLKMNPVGDGTTATADLPDDASAWYVSFFMKDGKCVSGELFERTSEDAAALRQLRAAFAKDGRFQADFSQKARDIRPALHSSGWSPRLYPRKLVNDDAAVKALRMTYTRTHDWALVNSGQRVVDTCRIFPLMHLDPKDPKNYVFGPTDEALKLARNVGLKIMYRLGESIEHTDGVHFNVLVPDDYEKYAEVMAGIVRHYNRGWANGYHWNIEYWNFWEEPDGISNLWCLPGKEGQDAMAMRKRFIRLFVTVMKRLKSEFPEIKFGGPALIGCNLSYFRDLVEACRAEGLKPDFISWDHYGHLPDRIFDDGRAARKLLDELDCPKTEIVLAEWHYLLTWTGIHGSNPTPEQVRVAKNGPTGINQIDSACYALTVLSRFQHSEFDQAYYYGCSHVGPWGYLDEDKAFNKPYRALCAFGNIVGDHSELCEAKSGRRSVTVLAARSADGARKTLLVTDYRGTEMSFEVSVKGVPTGAKPRVRRLDHGHADWVEIPAVWDGGKLRLEKETSGSAAFLVSFEDGE